MNTKLEIHYDEETDTLSMWNGQPVFSSYEVQQYLLIELDAERAPVGFTLEHAMKILQPHLQGNAVSTKPPTIGLAPDSLPASSVKEVPQPIFPEGKSRN